MTTSGYIEVCSDVCKVFVLLKNGVCSYSIQNESGDACNVATPADEVCTLQFSLVGIFVSRVLIWKCIHTSL